MASWVSPLGIGLVAPVMSEAARIKDISSIEGVRDNQLIGDRKSTRLNSSHTDISRMPSSA